MDELKKFKRNKDSYLMVIEDVHLWYRIGSFEGNENEVEADFVYEAKFETREEAETVCKMLIEEYCEGFLDGRIYEEELPKGE